MKAYYVVTQLHIASQCGTVIKCAANVLYTIWLKQLCKIVILKSAKNAKSAFKQVTNLSVGVVLTEFV